MERGRAEAAAAELPPDIERALGELSASARDRQVASWIGMARGEEGRTRVTVVWSPVGATSADGKITLGLDATAPDGTSLFSAPHTTSRELSFDAPPGDVLLAMTVRNGRGEEIDGDLRRIPVPEFDGLHLAIGSPIVLRTRTARDVRAMTEGPAIHPEVGREFDRADRLFIRFPVYGGPEVVSSARLLNRRGVELRRLTVGAVADGAYQVDLPLAASARGDYVIAIEAARGTDSVRTLVPIRVR